jgi:hypothetical protein
MDVPFIHEEVSFTTRSFPKPIVALIIIPCVQVLICIFEHLALDDIKSCRLACKRWNACCLRDSVADKGKLTFRSQVHTTDEMNAFLVGFERSRISLDFIGVNLNQLDFRAFGFKVKNLLITNCFADNEATIKDIFVFTPNLKSLSFSLVIPNGTHPDILRRVFVGLRQEKFINRTFERLECSFNTIDATEDLGGMFPQLHEIVCSKLDIARSPTSSVFLQSLPMSVFLIAYFSFLSPM